MSWQKTLDEVMADLQGGPLHPPAHKRGYWAREALSNLGTMESTIAHFSEVLPNPWTPEEERVLRKARRKLVMEAAARLLLYWQALRGEENTDGKEDSPTG